MGDDKRTQVSDLLLEICILHVFSLTGQASVKAMQQSAPGIMQLRPNASWNVSSTHNLVQQ